MASGPGFPSAPELAGPLGQANRHRRDAISKWANQKSAAGSGAPIAASDPGTPSERQSSFDLQFPLPESSQLTSRFANPTTDQSPGSLLPESPTLGSIAPEPRDATASTAHLSVSVQGTPAMQVYDRYLITESEEGVVVIDQHALHERIIYEEVREKVLAGDMEMQRLLVPEPVTLMPEEAAALSDHQSELLQLGIEVELLSGTTVVISAYPAMLSNLNPAEILRNVAELMTKKEGGAEKRDLLDELLHMISCKAAIKAGDRLTREEIASLMHRRQSVQDWHHCPHGRPTTLVFSRDELDRRFKRI